MHRLKRIRVGTVIVTAVLLAGCSVQSRRVECDGPLTPINGARLAVPTAPPAQSGQSP